MWRGRGLTVPGFQRSLALCRPLKRRRGFELHSSNVQPTSLLEDACHVVFCVDNLGLAFVEKTFEAIAAYLRDTHQWAGDAGRLEVDVRRGGDPALESTSRFSAAWPSFGTFSPLPTTKPPPRRLLTDSVMTYPAWGIILDAHDMVTAS